MCLDSSVLQPVSSSIELRSALYSDCELISRDSLSEQLSYCDECLTYLQSRIIHLSERIKLLSFPWHPISSRLSTVPMLWHMKINLLYKSVLSNNGLLRPDDNPTDKECDSKVWKQRVAFQSLAPPSVCPTVFPSTHAAYAITWPWTQEQHLLSSGLNVAMHLFSTRKYRLKFWGLISRPFYVNIDGLFLCFWPFSRDKGCLWILMNE